MTDTDIDSTIAPLSRGATRPPMLLGVPLTAFIVATVPIASASMFLSLFFDRLAYVLLLIPIPALIVMRELTKRDKHWVHEQPPSGNRCTRLNAQNKSYENKENPLTCLRD